MSESQAEPPNHERIPAGLAEALYPHIRACRNGRRTCDLHTSDIASTTMHDLFVFLMRYPQVIKKEDVRRLAFWFARHVTFDSIRKARRARGSADAGGRLSSGQFGPSPGVGVIRCARTNE